jgi:hypothetical protein
MSSFRGKSLSSILAENRTVHPGANSLNWSPGNANLPIGGINRAHREIGVPGQINNLSFQSMTSGL